MEKDKYMMSSLRNGLKILDALSREMELGVAALSRQLGIGKTSVFRMLYTLEKCRYVEKTRDSKYKLSMKFARYGALVTGWQNYVSTCIPHMARLRDKYNETVNLVVLTNDKKVMFIHNESSSYTMQMNTPFAKESQAYGMASGKVLLSYLNETDLNEYIGSMRFEPFTSNTITKGTDLRVRLDEIRTKGYAEDAEESEIGLTCYAAPIFDHYDQCIAAISISGATPRMLAQKDDLIVDVQNTAHDISLALGYSGKSKE